MKRIVCSLLFLLFGIIPMRTAAQEGVELIVLGTVQDAGSPQIGCQKACCADLFNNPDPDRMVVSLGLIDFKNKKSYLFEATPDIGRQLRSMQERSGFKNELPASIFLTHAHIGHYTGLMYLGKEAMSADQLPIYAMPRMKKFIEENGPWDQLVKLKNIEIQELEDHTPIALSESLKVYPLLVPHRDEYSETVGYEIIGPNKQALFIPDIDKWEKWDQHIIELIEVNDYVFIDATFYDEKEINNRDISEIPHPFIIESMELFKELKKNEKKKIYFIHLNHTNPALNTDSEAARKIVTNGFNIAQFNSTFDL